MYSHTYAHTYIPTFTHTPTHQHTHTYTHYTHLQHTSPLPLTDFKKYIHLKKKYIYIYIPTWELIENGSKLAKPLLLLIKIIGPGAAVGGVKWPGGGGGGCRREGLGWGGGVGWGVGRYKTTHALMVHGWYTITLY